MGLFDRKYCSICGEKVGLLDKSLADGYLCKNCLKKLSPFCEVNKKTSKQEIQEQLQYREENKNRLNSLNISRIYGDEGVILVDEQNRKFIAIADTSESLFGSSKLINCLEEAIPYNPDIIDFDMVDDVRIEKICNEREEKKTEEGKQVSYQPKHITYMCSFAILISIKNHPYVSFMRIPLNKGTIQIYTECPRQTVDLGRKLAADLLGLPGLDPEKKEFSYSNESLIATLLRSSYELPEYVYGFKTNVRNRDELRQYRYYMALSKQVKEILKPE